MFVAGSANEAQFGFTVESIVVPQKLRGTLTYMIQVCFFFSALVCLFVCGSEMASVTCDKSKFLSSLTLYSLFCICFLS